MVWMPWVLFHITASRACVFSCVPDTGGAVTSHAAFNAPRAAVSSKLVCDQRRNEKQGGKVQLNRTHVKMWEFFNVYAGQILKLKQEKDWGTCFKLAQNQLG